MNVSDLISIIALTLAILAFLSNSDREYIKNKFTKLNFLFLFITFIFINYLIFFDWWLGLIPILNKFQFKNYPSSKTWAYIISLITLSWLVLKIFFLRFPKTKQKDLISFYNTLLLQGEYTRLFKIINKYNINDISEYLNNKKNYLNTYIFENIVSDIDFIKGTETLNLSIYKRILTHKSTLQFVDNNFFYNFIDVELNLAKSKLNLELSYPNNKYDLINLIIKNHRFIKTKQFVNCIINKGTVTSNKLKFNFLLTKKVIEDNNHSLEYDFVFKNTLNSILFQENKKDLLKEYFDFSLKLFEQTFNNEYHFNSIHYLLLNSLLKIINIKELDSLLKKVISDLIKLSIEQESVLQNSLLIIRKECYKDFISKNEKTKKIANSIYNIFIEKYNSTESDFKKTIIPVISNY